MSSVSSGAAVSTALLNSMAAPAASAGDWINPSGSGASATWFESTSSKSAAAARQLTLNRAVAGSLATISANKAQGTNMLAGQAAYTRVVAAIKTKLAKPAANAAGSGSGFSNVQNLMASFDNITINNAKTGTSGTSLLNGANPLTAVDKIIATPKFDVQV